MPYGMEANISCPFFLRYNKKIHVGNITITCEPLEDNLGFAMTTKQAFQNEEERRAYMELFCCDGFEDCPMYKAILAKHERREKKHDQKQKTEKKALQKPDAAKALGKRAADKGTYIRERTAGYAAKKNGKHKR